MARPNRWCRLRQLIHGGPRLAAITDAACRQSRRQFLPRESCRYPSQPAAPPASVREGGYIARSWSFLGVVGLLLLCVPSSPSFCISGPCTQSTAAATATIIGSPAALRTTHDEINLVTTSGVVENEVRAITPFVTVGSTSGTAIRSRNSAKRRCWQRSRARLPPFSSTTTWRLNLCRGPTPE
jgi:hypothetical protein